MIPFADKTFNYKHAVLPLKIGDLIKNVVQYVHLYNFPDKSKLDLFDKYCTQADGKSHKKYYVLPHCKIEVPTKQEIDMDFELLAGTDEDISLFECFGIGPTFPDTSI